MLRSLLVLALACTGFASQPPARPQTPTEFSAQASITIVGKGQYQYSEPLGFDRLDQSFFGVPAITINDYNYNITYIISQSGPGAWTCKKQDTTGQIWPSQVPPYATFAGNATIHGVDTEHWTAQFFGTSVDYWVAPSAAPKQPSAIAKVSAGVAPLVITFEFTDVQPRHLNMSAFNSSMYGCPPPVPPQQWPLAGYAIDATTGQSIPGAVATLNSSASPAVTADSRGIYDFGQVDEGAYTISVTAAGYAPASAAVTLSAPIAPGATADVHMSPKLGPDARRFVLSWAAFPRDLDLHGTTAGGCEVYYASRGCSPAGWSATLDHDVTTGFGPETITVSGVGSSACGSDCSLRVRVYIYSSGTPAGFAVADTRVDYYDDTGLGGSFAAVGGQAPAGCRWWVAGELDVAAGTFAPAADPWADC